MHILLRSRSLVRTLKCSLDIADGLVGLVRSQHARFNELVSCLVVSGQDIVGRYRELGDEMRRERLPNVDEQNGFLKEMRRTYGNQAARADEVVGEIRRAYQDGTREQREGLQEELRQQRELRRQLVENFEAQRNRVRECYMQPAADPPVCGRIRRVSRYSLLS